VQWQAIGVFLKLTEKAHRAVFNFNPLKHIPLQASQLRGIEALENRFQAR